MVKNYNTSNLKLFLSGAAPLSKELEDEVFSRLGIKCTQGFGNIIKKLTIILYPKHLI
jgi:long-subunit acyl-CoA synthetase (AMP-forming)